MKIADLKGWSRSHASSLFVALLTAFALSPANLRAQDATSFTGNVDLPMEMYTDDGTVLKKGNFQLEVRLEKGGSSLLFKDSGQTVATVVGRSPALTASHPATVLLAGTFYMVSVKPGGDKDPYGRRSRDDWFKLDRPWKAAMRVYKSSGKANKAVYFIFQHEVGPEQWSRTEFKLRLSTEPS